MKKLILVICSVSLIIFNTAHADIARVSVKISSPVKDNRYFLCVYNVGCLSIRAGLQGKHFPLPGINLGNIKKFVITDARNGQVYTQPTDKSCDFMVKENQTVTISGHLIVKNSTPYINNLRCRIA